MFKKRSWEKAKIRTAVCLSELSCVMKKGWWIERRKRLERSTKPKSHPSTSRRKLTWSKDKKGNVACSFVPAREFEATLPSSFSYTFSQRLVRKNFALYLGNTVTSAGGLYGNFNRLRKKQSERPVSHLRFILVLSTL